MIARPPNTLDNLRDIVSRFLLVVLWLHVGLNLAVAFALDMPMLLAAGMSAGMAAAATACRAMAGNSAVTRRTIAVALIGMVSLVVGLLAGHAWQLDAHMAFFAAIAVLAAYCEWQVLLIAAAATALHHLVLNFLLPEAIYPGGPDLARVLLHAVLVALETGALIWLARELVALFALSSEALAAAQAARAAEAEASGAAAHALMASQRRETSRLLAEQFQGEVGSLVSQTAASATAVNQVASALSATAEEAACRTAAVVAASARTSANVRTVAAAASQLSASVQDVTRQIGSAASAAENAVSESRRSDAVVQNLSQAAQRIGSVVTLIKGIAAQTNLLALNATIEAARAGDAGRGFSVVANEVKTLAAQTARATEEIQSQIEAMVSETRQATGAIAAIAQRIGELGSVMASVTSVAAQQHQATQDIMRYATQAALGTEEVDQNLSVVTDSNTRALASAAEGKHAADELSRQCDGVARAVRAFVQDTLAA